VSYRSLNAFGQLPFWLYGIGMALIFSGIVWVQLTRRAQSIRIPRSLVMETSGAGRSGTDSAELEDEVGDVSSFGNVDYSKRKGKVGRGGVGAIFSSDETWSTVEHEGSRLGWISATMLANVIGWTLFLVVYAVLVQEYSSNAYMQSWIQARFSLGVYLLNDYMLLATATLLGFLLFRMIFLDWHHAKARKLD
jgi:hypothetical protein